MSDTNSAFAKEFLLHQCHTSTSRGSIDATNSRLTGCLPPNTRRTTDEDAVWLPSAGLHVLLSSPATLANDFQTVLVYFYQQVVLGDIPDDGRGSATRDHERGFLVSLRS